MTEGCMEEGGVVTVVRGGSLPGREGGGGDVWRGGRHRRSWWQTEDQGLGAIAGGEATSQPARERGPAGQQSRWRVSRTAWSMAIHRCWSWGCELKEWARRW